jgi:hypothetical protein
MDGRTDGWIVIWCGVNIYLHIACRFSACKCVCPIFYFDGVNDDGKVFL